MQVVLTDQVEPNLTQVERKVFALLRESWDEIVIRPKIRVEVFGKRRKLSVDFYIPSERLVVEAFGCFVHRCEECYGGYGSVETKKRYLDGVRIEALRRAGYECLVIWEHELSGNVLPSAECENTADPIPLTTIARA